MMISTLKSLTHILQLTDHDNKKHHKSCIKLITIALCYTYITTNNKEMHRQLFYEADSQSVFVDRFDSVLSSILSFSDSCASDDFLVHLVVELFSLITHCEETKYALDYSVKT